MLVKVGVPHGLDKLHEDWVVLNHGCCYFVSYKVVGNHCISSLF